MTGHRLFALILSVGFLVGGANHAHDILAGGLLPYRSVPLPVNALWTALCPLDFVAAAAIWRRLVPGLALGASIMLADVGVNSWLAYFSGLHLQSFEPLQVQTLFLGFILGGALLLRQAGGRSPG